MKVGIMQPYAFPYIGYFQLINCVDKWVVFDDTQYISKGWINRNRILHPDIEKEWQYFTVPIKKHARDCRIKEIEINKERQWENEFFGKLSHYKKKAPFYKQTIDFLKGSLDSNQHKLSNWTVDTLKDTCEYLELPFDYEVFSELDIKTDTVEHAGQWALVIANAMEADEYINPTNGYHLFKENEFAEKNIALRFLKPKLTAYSQRREGFMAGLSIIDVMMWNDKEEIQQMLMEYELLTYSQCRIG